MEALIYFAIVINDMDIFLTDYAGETLMDELRILNSSKDKNQLLGLTIRFRGILQE